MVDYKEILRLTSIGYSLRLYIPLTEPHLHGLETVFCRT